MAIKVDGAEKVIQRMYAFDKEVWKVLQREVRAATDTIRTDSQRATPTRALRKWGPWNLTTGSAGTVGAVTLMQGSRELGFAGTRVAQSMKSQARSRAGRGGADRSIYGRVVVNDAAGAIFTLAGSRNRSGDPFNDHLNRKHGNGPWPRLLGPAWTKNVDNARELIAAAIDNAAREVTRG